MTMEVEEKMEEGTEAVISTGATGSVSVSLHPLVVMNVSDHYTRVKVQSGSSDATGNNVGITRGSASLILNFKPGIKKATKWAGNIYSIIPPPTSNLLFFALVINNFVLFLVFGALLGRQKGRSVEICNSYELLVERVEDQFIIDQDYFTSKEEQCKIYYCIFTWDDCSSYNYYLSRGI